MKTALFTTFTLLFLTACSKPSGGLSITFEELGTEVNSKHGSDGLKYRSSINITGLGQNQVIGEILTVPGQKIPDTHAIPIITGCSKVAVSIYETNQTMSEIIKIKNALNSLIQQESLIVAIKSEKMLTQFLKERFIDEPKNQELKKEIKKYYNIKDENFLEPLNSKITTLKEEIKELNKELIEYKKTLDSIESGTIIARWSSEKEKSGGSFLDSLFSFNAKKHDKKEGFVILSGLKTESIWIGDDFADYLDVNKTGSDAILERNAYIVTYKLSAKYRAYSETIDYQKLISAKLSLSKKQISSLLGHKYGELFKKNELKLHYSFLNSLNSTNTGILSSPKKQLFEFRFRKDTNYAQSVIYNYKRSSRYSEVYSVRSNISNIGTKFKKTKPTELICIDNNSSESFLMNKRGEDIFDSDILDKIHLQ